MRYSAHNPHDTVLNSIHLSIIFVNLLFMPVSLHLAILQQQWVDSSVSIELCLISYSYWLHYSSSIKQMLQQNCFVSRLAQWIVQWIVLMQVSLINHQLKLVGVKAWWPPVVVMVLLMVQHHWLETVLLMDFYHLWPVKMLCTLVLAVLVSWPCP